MIDSSNSGAGGDGADECGVRGAECGIGGSGATSGSSSGAEASAAAAGPEPTVLGPQSPVSSSQSADGERPAANIQNKSRRRRRTRTRTNCPDEPDERISTNSLIRKVRDNSTWSQLVPEQRERLDSWLFDENLGYAKTAARVKKEFGIQATIDSVGRYYRRQARVRQADELVDAQLAADGLNGLGVDANTLRAAVMKLVGKAALNVANEKPEETKQLASLTQLLLEAEQNDLRRGRLELAERYFDFEKTVESLADYPKFRAYMQAIRDNPRLSIDQKIRRMKTVLSYWEKSTRKEQQIRDGK